MAFEKQDGVLKFTFEDAEALRAKYQENPGVRDALVKAAGDEAMADAILNGPTEDHLKALQERGRDDAEFISAFERVYGSGAAQALGTHNPSIGENIAEVPRAVVAGAQNAVAEVTEVVQNDKVDNDIRKMAADQLIAEAKEAGQAELEELRAITDKEAYEAKLKEHAENNTGPFGTNDFYPTDDELNARIEQLKTDGTELPQKKDFTRNDIFPEALTAGKVETGTGQVVEGVSQFATGFAATAIVPGGSIVKGANYGTKALKYGRALLRGASTDAFAFDPDDAQVVDLIEDTFGADLSGSVLEYIKKDDDDTDAEKRLKAALEGGALGVGVDAILTGLRGLKNARGQKLTEAEVATKVEELVQSVENVQPRPATNGKPRITVKTTPTQQAVERATGEPLPAPTAKEVARLRTMVEQRVKVATVRIEDNIQTDMEEVLKKDSTILEDAGIQNLAGLRQAAGPLMHEVEKLIDADDLDGLITAATKPGTRGDFRIRHAVFQSATKATKATLDNLKSAFEDLTPANTDPRVFDEIGNRLNASLDRYLTLRAIDQNFGSAAGRELQQRQMVQSVKAHKTGDAPAGTSQGTPSGTHPVAPKEAPKGVEEKAIREALENDYVSKWKADLLSRGAHPRDVVRIIDDYVKEADREGIKPGAKAREIDVEKTKTQKVVDAILTLRFNAMLSGIRTVETNIISGFLNSAAQVSSEALTAGLRSAGGDHSMTRAVAARINGMKNAAGISLQAAIKASYDIKPVLGDVHFNDADIAQFRNPILTAPTRALLFTDEFFKGIWYRGDIAYRAATEAEALPFNTAADRSAYIKQRIAEATGKDGEALDLVALSHAQEITFQKRFNPKSKYRGERIMAQATDWVNKRDGSGLGEVAYLAKNAFFPFARVSFRLTDAGIRLTPGLRTAVGLFNKATGAESQWFDDFFGKNGYKQQARAYGEFVMGWSMTAYAWAHAMDGNMTGGAPQDYIDANGDRKTILPYHIKIGGKWYDYSRYDPFATPLKLTANAVQGYRKIEAARDRNELQKASEEIEAVAGVAGYMFAEMFTSNSFAKGIQSLVELGASEDTAGAAERAFDTYATSYVPNILKKTNQALLGKDEVYRGNNPLEKIYRHFAWVSPDRFGLDRQRDPFLGEPEVIHSMAAGWTNLASTDQPNDPVHAMLKEARDATGAQMTLKRPTNFANISINGKSYSLPPGTDLSKLRASNGKQTIYDLYLETVSTVKLNGKTYRETLLDVANNEEFKEAPWGNHRVRDNEKIEYLRKIKTAFEKAGLAVISQEKALFDLARTQRGEENYFAVRN